MSWIITIAVGVVIGWAIGLISSRMRVAGVYANIIHGIAGSIMGFWFFVTTLGLGVATSAVGVFNGLTLVWEIIGAVAFLIIINAVLGAEHAVEERHAYGRGTAHEYEDEKERRRRR